MKSNNQFEITKFVVRGIILNDKSEILIFQRPEGLWCLPGGKVEIYYKDTIDALKREIFEETNLYIYDQQLFSTIDNPLIETLWVNHYFLVTKWEGDIQINPDQSTDYKWISRGDLMKFKFAFGNNKVLENYLKI